MQSAYHKHIKSAQSSPVSPRHAASPCTKPISAVWSVAAHCQSEGGLAEHMLKLGRWHIPLSIGLQAIVHLRATYVCLRATYGPDENEASLPNKSPRLTNDSSGK